MNTILDNLICKLEEPKDIILKDYNHLNFKLNDVNMDSEILKSAKNKIYKNLGISYNTSKEVFKTEKAIWTDLISKCNLINENRDGLRAFNLKNDNISYILDQNNNIVDIGVDCDKNDIKNRLEILNLELTTTDHTKKFFADSKNDTLKLVCYDKDIDIVKEHYTPIVILEMNHNKSIYNVYTGILIYNNFTFLLNIDANIKETSFIDLLYSLNMNEQMDLAKQDGQGLYEKYQDILKADTEISVRELTRLLKKHCGYKLEYDPSNDSLLGIQQIQDSESNKLITNYYNTFEGESAIDVITSSELKQIFKYNKLTLVQVLRILSKEYLNYESSRLTANTLSLISYDLISKNMDKIRIQDLK